MSWIHKINDCYFYYYSSCYKGNNCIYRHEPSALGCDTMCESWFQGKCVNEGCKLRHMILKKNRKQIPCYWENKPGGCRKEHCNFLHKKSKIRTAGIVINQLAPDVDCDAANEIRSQFSNHDLIINIKHVSDCETESTSPIKHPSSSNAQFINEARSQELLQLEKVQREMAAFYSYDSIQSIDIINCDRVAINSAPKYKSSTYEILDNKQANDRDSSLDFKVLTLDEIRSKKKTLETGHSFTHSGTPITLNLNRKRKNSTQEHMQFEGNKIIKIVKNNSIIYKKLHANTSRIDVNNKLDSQRVASKPKSDKNMPDVVASLR